MQRRERQGSPPEARSQLEALLSQVVLVILSTDDMVKMSCTRPAFAAFETTNMSRGWTGL